MGSQAEPGNQLMHEPKTGKLHQSQQPTLRLTLKRLWDGCLTFSILPIISDMEKVFA
jgi:hypothetical protein